MTAPSGALTVRRGDRRGRRVLSTGEVLAAPVSGQPRWQAWAACTGRPAGWWWPEPDSIDTSGLRARRVCARCPVVADCRDFLLSRPELDGSGIWAGLTGHALRAAAADPTPVDPGVR